MRYVRIGRFFSYVLLGALLGFAAPPQVLAKGGGHSGGGHNSHGSSHGSRGSGRTHTRTKSHSPKQHHARTYHSHTKRSAAARRRFMHMHPCPSTGKTSGACPGYVVDHIKPLKEGGADDPSNMQWQTVEAAKAKDKWE